MKKMWKKVMTIILALVMTLGLGTSVQAAALNSGENTNSTNVTITGLPAGKDGYVCNLSGDQNQF